MTGDQAVVGITGILGGGGLSAVLVAVFAFLTEARKGRKPSDGAVSIAVQAGLGSDKWPEMQAGHLAVISATLIRLTAVLEISVEDAYSKENSPFGDRLNMKEMHLLRDVADYPPDAKHR